MVVEPYEPDKLWSADEYLAWESRQEFKNELIDNRVWLMLGANLQHNSISMNLMMALYRLVQKRGLMLFGGRMCLEVERQSTFVYPDMTIVPGEPNMSCRFEQHTFEDPIVIFEIVSPDTCEMDRGRKKDLYLGLPSLQAYYLIAQDEALIEAHIRQGAAWQYREWRDLDAAAEIITLDCQLPLSKIYADTSLVNRGAD